jgi:hypothetical protein
MDLTNLYLLWINFIQIYRGLISPTLFVISDWLVLLQILMLLLFPVKHLSNNFISGCIGVILDLEKVGKVVRWKIDGAIKVLDDIQIVI